jgi:DNA polymerase-3 subunit delta
MQVRPEQLAAQLARGLAPVYVLSGDEPLLVQEAADAIRARARAEGFSERELLDVDARFDWRALADAASSLSLFAERRILELRLPGGKPGDQGARALSEYAAAPATDTLLLLICGKLDAATRKSKWYSAITQAGVELIAWPIAREGLTNWVAQRMKARGLLPEGRAAALIAERAEGNLLAAVQEIEKLWLARGAGAVDEDAVCAAVSDQSRFDVFALADAALAGDAARTARVLTALRGEGEEPVLILWALTRELRTLAAIAGDCERGMASAAALARHRVWDKRKPLVQAALRRLPARGWRALLAECARLDAVIKGQASGNPWDELLHLSLCFSGKALPLAATV